ATLERLQRCDAEQIGAGLQHVSVPSWLVQIILTCLRPDPADRFASALDLAEALTQELAHAGHSSAEIKARLADIVRAALPEIGTVTPLEPMAPALGSGGGFRSLRWMGVGAVAAVLGFGGLYAATELLPTMGTKAHSEALRFEAGSIVSEPTPAAIEAEDPTTLQVEPPPRPAPPPTVRPAAEGAPDTDGMATETGTESG